MSKKIGHFTVLVFGILPCLVSCRSSYNEGLVAKEGEQVSLVDELKKISSSRIPDNDEVKSLVQKFGNPLYDSTDKSVKPPVSSLSFTTSRQNENAIVPNFEKATRVIYWQRQIDSETDEIVGLFFLANSCHVFEARILPP